MEKLNRLCNDLELQALVITADSNIKYICGFLADTALIVIVGNSKYYLTDSRFTLEAKLRLGADYKVLDTERNNPYELAKCLIGTVNRVGCDTDISYYQYSALSKAFNDYEIVDITTELIKLRVEKSTYEIDNIIIAQRIAEKSLEELKSMLKAGVSEREIAAKLEYLMKLNGSTQTAFETIVAFGENSALPHAKSGEKKLKLGDIVLIDFGATYNNYRSDMTRSFVYGQCSDKIKEIYNIVLDANISTISAIGNKMKCTEIDSVARDIIDKSGYGKYYIHSTGHGVGIDIHEEPYISQNSKVVGQLTEGMVVTVEPGIYIEGLGGIRIEDMIVVKDGKALNLTTTNKNLEILNV